MLNWPGSAAEDDAPFISTADLLAWRWRQGRTPKDTPPQAVIIAHQQEPIGALLKHHRARKIEGFFGDLRMLTTSSQPIGVLHPAGPGAPVMAAVLEELIAFGVARFVAIGLAGGLQPDLFPGDIVVCDRALRDEGTSYHYLPPARTVEPHPALVQQIAAAFLARGISHSIGTTWTTDAVYRETRRAVDACRAEGVKTVEMEAAALFAVGERLKVPTAAIFVISDRLIDRTWQPVEDMRLLRHRASTIMEALVDMLSME